jgi:hypothetical protein
MTSSVEAQAWVLWRYGMNLAAPLLGLRLAKVLTRYRTHHMTPEPVIIEDFTADQCEESAGTVLTYGAGETFLGLYEYLKDTGYMVSWQRQS